VLRRLLPAAVAAAALAVPGVASATSTVDIHTNNLASESESLGNYHLGGYDVLGVSEWDVDVASKATWTAGLDTHVAWDTANVRQGASLPVTRFTPLINGTMKVSWSVSGSVKVGELGGAFSTKSMSVSATCLPVTLGTGYDCTANSPALYLVKTPGLPNSPYVKLLIKTKFTVTPEGAITNRTFTTSGGSSSATLPLSQAINYETLKVPCAPVGSAASYRLGSIHYTPAVSAFQSPTIQVGFMDPVLGAAEMPAVVDKPFGPSIKANPAFDLSGAGHATDLGDLLPNNVKPTVSLMDTYTGAAGSPVYFNAVTSSKCAVESYVWKFSDGTTSYGKSPSRTFATAGTYQGELTVTDESGMKAVRDFSVVIG
jgi:chitodextrinase